MKKIFPPTTDAQDWKKFLAGPEKQWKMGFSARTLAYTWEATGDRFPSEIDSLFRLAEDERVSDLEAGVNLRATGI